MQPSKLRRESKVFVDGKYEKNLALAMLNSVVLSCPINRYAHNSYRNFGPDYYWTKCSQCELNERLSSWHDEALEYSQVVSSLFKSIDDYLRTELSIIQSDQKVSACFSVVQITKDDTGSEIANPDGFAIVTRTSNRYFGILSPKPEAWHRMTLSFAKFFQEIEGNAEQFVGSSKALLNRDRQG